MNTSHSSKKSQRVRTFMRYMWGDQVAANRALLQLRPYDDYLMNHRHER
jgi:hypothetical protein